MNQDDALDLALQLALGLNLELNSEEQAGPAYLGKGRGNRPYKRKLAERATRDETLRNEVNKGSRKSTEEVNITGVKAISPLARVESEVKAATVDGVKAFSIWQE